MAGLSAFGLGTPRRVWVSGGLRCVSGLLAALFSLVWRPKRTFGIYLGLVLIVAYPIGFVVSYLILGTMLWYVMLAPVGACSSGFTGRDLLNRRFEPG